MRCGKDQGCLMRSGWSPCCALMTMIERQRATRARACVSRACVCGRVEGCSSARSLVGVTIMYLRSSVHFIRRWPFSPASCTSYRCLTLPSRFWRPAPQPLVTFCARSPRLPPLGCATVAFIALAPQLSVTFCAPLFSGALLFFHFSSTKRKENRGAATQDTQVAIRIEQQATHNINPRITRTMRSKLKSRCRVL